MVMLDVSIGGKLNEEYLGTSHTFGGTSSVSVIICKKYFCKFSCLFVHSLEPGTNSSQILKLHILRVPKTPARLIEVKRHHHHRWFVIIICYNICYNYNFVIIISDQTPMKNNKQTNKQTHSRIEYESIIKL